MRRKPSHVVSPSSAKALGGSGVEGAGSPRPDAAATWAEPRGAPGWLYGLLALLVGWGLVYVAKYGADPGGKAGWFPQQVYDPFGSYAALVLAQPPPEVSPLTQGRRLYERNCQPCHLANGAGVAGQFPPLAGSEWVLEPGPGRLIRLLLHGLEGPITVQGERYDNPMFAFRDLLNDEEVAAVLTFVRSQWGNAAPAVSPQQVQRVRAATAERDTAWTEPELQAIPPNE